jgi:lysophospholipase L1-like esterase
MPVPRTRRRYVASSIVAVLALLFGVVAPASAAPPDDPVVQKYVALGDSYAAGQGAGAPLDACLRSAAAYPVLLDAEPRTNLLRTAACSGATIADVTASQLSQVNRGTTLVTLTVGPNDLGVGLIYRYCSIDQTSVACLGSIGRARQKLETGVLAQDLAALIGAIAARAPRAQIIVTDYPIPFAAGNELATEAVNFLTGLLNGQIDGAVQSAAATGANAELASVVVAFAGHEAGTADAWLGADPADALTFLHPTAAGQAAYRDIVLAELAD